MFKLVKIFIFFSLFFIPLSCEDDQICIEQLSLKFKAEIKPLNPSSIFTIDTIKITDITGLNNVEVFSGNSISEFQALLPQNLTTVIYKIDLTFLSTDPLQPKAPMSEVLTINYNSNNTFVSKACGFKTSYNNLSYSVGGLLTINDSKTEINNKNETHLNLQF
ncbi:MAG: hypothetical protein ACEQSF_00625 [Solirubrobacteraceae bacterium]